MGYTWLSDLPCIRRHILWKCLFPRIYHIFAVSRKVFHRSFILSGGARLSPKVFGLRKTPDDKWAWRTALVINGRAKPKCPKEKFTPSQRHFVHHKFHINYSGVEPGPRYNKLGPNSLRYGMGLRIIYWGPRAFSGNERLKTTCKLWLLS